MKVSLDIPDIETLPEVDEEYVKELVVTSLYHMGRISESQTCEMTGVTRREFEEILPKFGYSVLSDDPKSIAVELNA